MSVFQAHPPASNAPSPTRPKAPLSPQASQQWTAALCPPTLLCELLPSQPSPSLHPFLKCRASHQSPRCWSASPEGWNSLPGLFCVSESSQSLEGPTIPTCARNPSPAAPDMKETILSVLDGHWDHMGTLKAAVTRMLLRHPGYSIGLVCALGTWISRPCRRGWTTAGRSNRTFHMLLRLIARPDLPAKCIYGFAYLLSTLTRS